MNTVNELVKEALKLSGSKTRFSGTVSRIDGTTTFIQAGDGREYLTWTRPELKVGTPVTFAKDQLQAVRVQLIGEKDVEV
jgi:hypothetical protein